MVHVFSIVSESGSKKVVLEPFIIKMNNLITTIKIETNQTIIRS
jgi:hypothetical protein